MTPETLTLEYKVGLRTFEAMILPRGFFEFLLLLKYYTMKLVDFCKRNVIQL